MSRNALGRGLSALIREPVPLQPAPQPAQVTVPPAEPSGGVGAPLQVGIDLIDPSPYQPRSRFSEQGLEELAQSIRSKGIIQPLVVRPVGRRYQLIAGERRWRAAQRAGLSRVPAVLREIPEDNVLEITLIENLQREDLNPIEQARGFERLMAEFNLRQEDIAERTGKDRATIANVVRLLNLEPPIQDWIEEGRLSSGHGRALLSLSDSKLRLRVARRAARGGITVRQIERLAAARVRGSVPPQSPPDPNVRAAIEDLQRLLGTRVLLRPPKRNKPGFLMIEYYDDRQLSGLYERVLRS